MNAADYLDQVRIPKGESGGYAVEHFRHKAGKPLDTSNMRTSIIGGQVNAPVTYDRDTTWHRLKYKGGVWMTDLPIEQQQHRNALSRMRGDVLVGGLGLGLAANWLAASPEVESVTVVEISKEVVHLVGPHLRDPRGKIRVVRQDLFKYLKGHRISFDWAFYDIWQSDGEGTFFETVCPLRKASIPFVEDSRVVCWNEDVMRGQLAMSLWSRASFTGIPESEGGLSLKRLAHPEDRSIWMEWSVPFFRAMERGAVTSENLQESIRVYAGGYGRPGFLRRWNLKKGAK